MASGPSKSLANNSIDGEEEFSDFCENFTFPGTVSYYFLKFKRNILKNILN